MKYNRLHINHFGKLHNQTLEFADGINLIYEPESGTDSPLHDFFESMHYGMTPPSDVPSESSLYRKNYPETGSSTYGGVMEFSRNDATYSIYRNFKRDPQGYTLMDEKAGRQLNLTEAEYLELLGGISHPLFRDTLACSHTASPNESADQLRREIQNLCVTGSSSIDLELAEKRLQADRRKLEADFSPESQRRAEELTRTYRQLSEERSRLSHSAELAQREKERRNLQHTATLLQDRQAALEQAIANEEAYLQEHTGSADQTPQDAENECHRLLARREKLLRKFPDPNTGLFPGIYQWVLVTTLAVILLALAAGIFFLITQDRLTASFCFIICGVTLAILFGYSLPRYKGQLIFQHVDNSLEALYRQFMEDTPDAIDQQSLDQFLRFMEDLKNRRSRMKKCRKELTSINDRLAQLQVQQTSISTGMDTEAKDFQRMIQLDEQLGQIEAEMDGLTTVLERNQVIRREMRALDEAHALIEDLARSDFRTFRRYLSQFSTQLIGEMSHNRWNKISIDDRGSITLEQDQRIYTPEDIGLEDLFLIALSLRIAQIGYIWPKESVPLFLHENLFQFDPHMVLDLMSWLSEYYPGQIFLFTSRKNEEEILRKAKIPYQRINA